MIKITAKVKIYDESDNVVDSDDVASNAEEINVSSSIQDIVNRLDFSTRRLFQLKNSNGVGSKLDGSSNYSFGTEIIGNTIVGKELFYIGKRLSGSTQESYTVGGGYPFNTSVDIVFSIDGEHTELPNRISIVFDESHNMYATRVIVVQDGTETQIINGSTILNLKVENQESPLTVKIMAWSEPNSPIVISSIYANLYFDIDEDKMIGCEFELNEKADPTLPKFGVISNDGSLEFRDYDGKFLELIEQGRLHEKKQVSFYLENTYDRTKQEISTFLSNDVSYDDDSRTATISLVDNLVAWQDIKDVRIYLQKNKTMKDVYDALVDLSAPLGYEFADIDNDNEFSDLKSYLMSITLGYFFLKSDSLWAQWQKFCEATGLYLYINKENKIVLGGEFNF